MIFRFVELAIWMVGPPEDGACVSNDCLLNILIENAQDNSDILLPTLQFVEVWTRACVVYSTLFTRLDSFDTQQQ